MWLSARGTAATALTLLLAASAVGCSGDDRSTEVNPLNSGQPSAADEPTAQDPAPEEDTSADPGTETSPEPDEPAAPTADKPGTPSKAPEKGQPSSAGKPSKDEFRDGWSKTMGLAEGQEDPGMNKFLDCLADNTYDQMTAKGVQIVAEGPGETQISKKDDQVIAAAYEKCSATG